LEGSLLMLFQKRNSILPPGEPHCFDQQPQALDFALHSLELLQPRQLRPAVGELIQAVQDEDGTSRACQLVGLPMDEVILRDDRSDKPPNPLRGRRINRRAALSDVHGEWNKDREEQGSARAIIADVL